MEYGNFNVEFLRRTKENLEIIKKSGNKYGVTQIINSFIGIIAFPFANCENEVIVINDSMISPQLLSQLPVPKVDTYNEDKVGEDLKYKKRTLLNLIWHLRNAVAHGSISEKTRNGEIVALQFEDKWERNDVLLAKFRIHITVEWIEKFINEFYVSVMKQYNSIKEEQSK